MHRESSENYAIQTPIIQNKFSAYLDISTTRSIVFVSYRMEYIDDNIWSRQEPGLPTSNVTENINEKV